MPAPVAALLLGGGLLAALALGGKGGSSSSSAHPAGPGAPGVPGLPGGGVPLDPNLPPDTAHAVQVALATETDPRKLRSFAASLLPEYPIAAAALNAKAAAIEAAHGQLPTAPPGFPVPPPGVIPGLPGMPLPPPPMPVPPTAPPGFPPIIPTGFAPFPAPGSQALVATHDTGAAGQLAIRQTPSTDGAVVGWSQHGSLVTITGPGQNGFLPIAGPGGQGWSSASYLADPGSGASAAAAVPGAINFPPLPGAPALSPNSPITMPQIPGLPDLQGATFPASFPLPLQMPNNGDAYVVATQTDPLNVRAVPDPNGAIIGSNPKGSVVTVTGPAINGFFPISSPGGDGFSSADYLVPQGTSVSAGFAPGAFGPPGPFAGAPVMAPPPPFVDLEASAVTLQDALKSCGCRSYNEPKVKAFQRAATRAGIYAGPIDGFYGTTVQGALAKVVGAPAPPCFPEPKGGPFNANEYWSPIGT